MLPRKRIGGNFNCDLKALHCHSNWKCRIWLAIEDEKRGEREKEWQKNGKKVFGRVRARTRDTGREREYKSTKAELNPAPNGIFCIFCIFAFFSPFHFFIFFINFLHCFFIFYPTFTPLSIRNYLTIKDAHVSRPVGCQFGPMLTQQELAVWESNSVNKVCLAKVGKRNCIAGRVWVASRMAWMKIGSDWRNEKHGN